LKQYRRWSPFQQAVFRSSMAQQADGTWSSKFVVQARNEVFEDILRVSGLTESIDRPTLLVLPTKGLNRTTIQINPYKRFLKNLRIASVPGNHWCFLVEPEAFNQTVISFLNSVWGA
jgi:pimeloyl-ACP methyl ester carboxylesterase